MNSSIVNADTLASNEVAIRRFCRVFCPSQLSKVKAIASELGDLPRLKLQESLYKKFIESRFITLKKQKNVFFPEQRSEQWFKERARVPSSITGSRPSGWFFGLKDQASYDEHLAYIHLGKKQTFDEATLKRMRYGCQFEDTAAYRFLEWGLKNRLDVFIYETGFVRNTSYPFLGASPDGVVGINYSGTVVGERTNDEGNRELLMAYYDLCDNKQTTIVCGTEKIEAGLAHKPLFGYKPCNSEEISQGWEQSTLQGEQISAIVHSILEIKCPEKKMYSNVPNYYLVQLVRCPYPFSFYAPH